MDFHRTAGQTTWATSGRGSERSARQREKEKEKERGRDRRWNENGGEKTLRWAVTRNSSLVPTDWPIENENEKERERERAPLGLRGTSHPCRLPTRLATGGPHCYERGSQCTCFSQQPQKPDHDGVQNPDGADGKNAVRGHGALQQRAVQRVLPRRLCWNLQALPGPRPAAFPSMRFRPRC